MAALTLRALGVDRLFLLATMAQGMICVRMCLLMYLSVHNRKHVPCVYVHRMPKPSDLFKERFGLSWDQFYLLVLLYNISALHIGI